MTHVRSQWAGVSGVVEILKFMYWQDAVILSKLLLGFFSWLLHKIRSKQRCASRYSTGAIDRSAGSPVEDKRLYCLPRVAVQTGLL
jgi:hypothetical protein